MTKLEKLRKKKHLSRKQLEAMTGVKWRIIQNYELDTLHLEGARAITVLKLARALGTTVDYLIT